MCNRRFKTIIYRLRKSKLLKKLGKMDNPDSYLEVYESFLSIFKDYKQDKYDEDKINEMFDNFLLSKGLKKIESIILELESRKQVKDDNYIVMEIRQRMEGLEEQFRNLQELTIKLSESNKEMKKLVNEKLKILNNLTGKKQSRNRTTIS